MEEAGWRRWDRTDGMVTGGKRMENVRWRQMGW